MFEKCNRENETLYHIISRLEGQQPEGGQDIGFIKNQCKN